MDKATALGFYASHPVIMDELYEVEDLDTGFDEYARENQLPMELCDFVKPNVEFLNALFQRVEVELRELEEGLRASLRARVESCAQLMPTRVSDWSGKISLAPLAVVPTQKCIELGWDWATAQDALWIDTWIWMRGGRQAERVLINSVREFGGPTKNVQGAKDHDRSWSSGMVRLGRIDVTALVGPDFALDLDQLKKEVLNSFSWIDERSLGELFKRACDL